MRISDSMMKKLDLALHQSFGDVPVYLFGSRADAQKIGGDIDLAVDVNLTQTAFKQKRVKFKTALARMGFDEIEVDIVPYHAADALLAREISATAVPLITDRSIAAPG